MIFLMFENFSELGLGTSNPASFGRALSFKKAKNLIDQAIDADLLLDLQHFLLEVMQIQHTQLLHCLLDFQNI